MPRCRVQQTADALESEELVLGLECGDGEAWPDDVQLVGLPSGVSFDPRSRQLRWTPSLDQAGHHAIELRSDRMPMGEIGIDVADRFVDPNNIPVQQPEQYLREYGLPVIHLGVAAGINDAAHEPATFVYRGHTFAGVTAKYRGSTSRKYPKRSYTVRFEKSDPFIDRDNGFRGARRIVLTTTFDDNSYLRQRLAYGLWNRLSQQHLPIHAFNAVVFLDGRYHGLYVVSDHLDDDFLEDAGVYGHGNLYKAREHDANFRLLAEDGDPKATLHDGYTKEEGDPAESEPGAFDDLDALVEWIATATDDAFAAEFDQRLLRSEFEDWLMFVCLIQATDSAGKNSYLYRDPRPGAADPRWRYLPWDFNASFGQGYRTQRRSSSDYPLEAFVLYNELFARLLRDQRLAAPLRERFRAALAGPWALADVLAGVEQWAESIEPSALRDEQKWGPAYRDFWSARTDFTTYAEEAHYLRRWIEERWSVIDAGL